MKKVLVIFVAVMMATMFVNFADAKKKKGAPVDKECVKKCAAEVKSCNAEVKKLKGKEKRAKA
ncbi:MAG TPA: hypothetical protein PKJ16_12990, partial [Spirochaetota bacterium]|nr:hypothetical protein [Spirochaetota bacterium]